MKKNNNMRKTLKKYSEMGRQTDSIDKGVLKLTCAPMIKCCKSVFCAGEMCCLWQIPYRLNSLTGLISDFFFFYQNTNITLYAFLFNPNTDTTYST